MANKTAMTFLIEKILRMPESNIKTFLNISGTAYLESEKEQIVKAYLEGESDGEHLDNSGENYYNKTYNTTKQ